MCTSVLTAMSANPEVFADEIVRFLLADPGRRLDFGYDYVSGSGELFVAVSRTAVAASAAHCSAPLLADLEGAILHLEPHRALSIESKEKEGIELALLWCLPDNRVKATTRERIRVLEEQFPDEDRRGAPEYDDDDNGFQWAVSPIPDEEALNTSNEQWLTTMRDVGKSGESFQGDRFVGGAHELSQTLEARPVKIPLDSRY